MKWFYPAGALQYSQCYIEMATLSHQPSEYKLVGRWNQIFGEKRFLDLKIYTYVSQIIGEIILEIQIWILCTQVSQPTLWTFKAVGESDLILCVKPDAICGLRGYPWVTLYFSIFKGVHESCVLKFYEVFVLSQSWRIFGVDTMYYSLGTFC